jgi:MoxR-like ATPase
MALVCALCGHETPHYLGDHLAEEHDLRESDYTGGPVTSPELDAAYEAHYKGKRRRAPDVSKLTVTMSNVTLPVNVDVPAEACRPMPGNYRVPVYGKLADAVRRVVVRYAHGNGKPIWVWGLPGTGKDAVFDALSAQLRRPCMVFNIAPDVDIAAWLAARAFSTEGTFWEEGQLLKALRDGYTAPNGKVYPYLIVLSDIDRASRAQMEPLRAILDSLGGRVMAPNGMHKVLPGTVVVATANTSGSGDSSGRFTSSPVDVSIMDRFTFKVTFTDMDPRDEEPILRAKYPNLAARFPDLIPTVLKATASVREAIQKDEIAMDFGHRTVCNWMDATSAEAVYYPTADSGKVLRAGLQDILSGCPDEDTREAFKRLVDAHIRGGAVDEGDTSHISNNPLAP